MKSRHVSIILTLVVILLAVNVWAPGSGGITEGVEKSGSYIKKTCTCSCRDQTFKATAMDYKGFVATETDYNELTDKCQAQCARMCGGSSQCSGDPDFCSDCCVEHCASDFDPGDPAAINLYSACIEGCNSHCEYRGTIGAIIDIIYTVSGILGGVMISIHAVRLITSQDPSSRQSAKSSILYVVMALTLIALSGAAVRLFMGADPGSLLPGYGKEDSSSGGVMTPGDCASCTTSLGDRCTNRECLSIGSCMFFDNILSVECKPCPRVYESCTDYPPGIDEMTCINNPCKAPGTCYFDGTLCQQLTTAEESLDAVAICTKCREKVICTRNYCQSLAENYNVNCWFSSALGACYACDEGSNKINSCADYGGDEYACTEGIKECGIECQFVFDSATGDMICAPA